MRVYIVLALVGAVLGDGLHGGHRGGRAGLRGGRRGGRGFPRRGREDAFAAAGGGYAAPSADAAAAGGYAAPAAPELPNDVPVYAGEEALGGYAADDVGGDPALDMLQSSIPGVPGEDYPIYSEVPETGFACDDKIDGGYYADPEAECQAFHICTADGQGGLAKYSFLCPNGTILNQNYLICDWWFNFDCSEAEALAEEINAQIAAEREAASADAGQATYGAPAAEYGAAAAALPPPPPAYDDYEYEAPADAYAVPTEVPAYDDYDTEAPLEAYGGDAGLQEERRRRTFGRAGRRLGGGRRNGRRGNGRRQFRG